MDIEQTIVEILKRLAKLEDKQNAKQKAGAIDTDWFPEEKEIKWAKENYPTFNLKREIEIFIDYWKSTGKTKVDWSATFRNWIRRATSSEPSAMQGRPHSRTASIDSTNRDRADRTIDKLDSLRRSTNGSINGRQGLPSPRSTGS